MQRKRTFPFRLVSHLVAVLYALVLSASLVVFTMLGPLSLGIPIVLAHAYLLRSDPPANAILNAPPQVVRLWFSEDLNPFTSHAVIVDTTNHEVDTAQGTVNTSNAMEIDVTPLLLHAGTYVVVWRSQSAQDGHITGGSFIFRTARPDGSIPPVPNVLPTGHFPGAAGSGLSANATLDGPTILQTLMTWLALLGMTWWFGGVFWETWILPPGCQSDPDVAAASRRAHHRFQWLAFSALIVVLLSDIGIVFGQAAEVAGAWSGIFSLPILRAVLFGSHFGTMWWVRQGIASLAFLVLLFARRYDRREQDEQVLAAERKERSQTVLGALHEKIGAIPNWRSAVLETLRHIPALPSRLVAGWHARSWVGWLEVFLSTVLVVAFALSGHAAAVPSSQLASALSVDLLHLICTVTWVGGLLYLGTVFVPTLSSLTASQRTRVIALGLPEFSTVAILSVLILASTGSLNTAIHLTSLAQLLTTLYGGILIIKISLFLVMMAMSTYHAFFLRTRLVQIMNQSDPSTAVASRDIDARGEEPQGNEVDQNHPQMISRQNIGSRDRLTRRIGRWIQWEAVIGGGILLCVALLGAFAGTLAPLPPAVTQKTAQFTGPFQQTQAVQGYNVTLKVAPDTFGTNTFRVTINDAQRHPVQGAAVLAQITMLDMDMGTDVLQLQAASSSAGTFSGQGELTMAGHWQVRLRILPPNEQRFVIVVFSFATR